MQVNIEIYRNNIKISLYHIIYINKSGLKRTAHRQDNLR